MIDFEERKRWGKLLDILAEMSDVERQVVVQEHEPAVFVPDDLLERWTRTYRGGRGLSAIGVPQETQVILMEFSYSLDQIVDILPTEMLDPVSYIRHDEIWQAVREMATWTLERITEETIPDNPEFSLN